MLGIRISPRARSREGRSQLIAAAALSLLDLEPPVPLAVSEEQRAFAHAQLACGRYLARAIAQFGECSEAEAFDALTFIPDNMLSLLNSPEGWFVLSQYVADDLGLTGHIPQPTIQ